MTEHEKSSMQNNTSNYKTYRIVGWLVGGLVGIGIGICFIPWVLSSNAEPGLQSNNSSNFASVSVARDIRIQPSSNRDLVVKQEFKGIGRTFNKN